MALTRVAASGISTGGTFVLENVNTSGIVTAGTVQVGAATTIHSAGIDLGSGNITSHNINSTGIITATGGFVGAVTGNVTGNLTGNVTGNVSSSGANTLGSLTVTNDATVGGALTITGNLTVNGTTTTIDTAVTAVDSLAIDGDASVGGALTATGNITANAFYGDGSNLTGIDATQIVTGNTSVQTVDTGSDGHVKVTTEGTERLRISANGDINIDSGGVFYDATNNRFAVGTTSPTKSLEIAAGSTSGNGILVTGSSSPLLRIEEASGVTGQFGLDGAGAYLTAVSNHPLIFSTNSTERVRIDSSGRLLVGTSSAYTGYGGSASNKFQIAGNAYSNAAVSAFVFGGTTSGGYLNLGLSRNTTIGSHTVVNNDDALGAIRFNGSDGSAFKAGALIEAYVDGTPGTNDMPCRLTFSTTADGASSPTERMRITSSGRMGLGTASPGGKLDVKGDASSNNELWLTNGNTANYANKIRGRDASGTVNATMYFSCSDNSIVFEQGTSTERMRIDSSGRLLIGSTSTAATGRLFVTGNNGAATMGMIHIQRGEASTDIDSGDWIGELKFTDINGGEFAKITCSADAAPSSGDHPGRLEFWTTVDGSGTPDRRMKITNNGTALTGGNAQVLINNASPGYNENFHITSYGTETSGTNYGVYHRHANNGYKPSNTSFGHYIYLDTFGPRTAFKAETNSGWNDTNIAVHGKSGGGQYSQGIGVLAEIQHSDANGPGWQPALYAKGVSATNSTSGGAGCAVFHLVNSQPAANPMNKCIDEYNGSNTRQWFTFTRNGSQIGSISHTSSSTSYNTSSDYRLKENIVDLTGQDAETRLRLLPVKRFNFISEPGKTVDGFLAHEVAPHVPEAVTGEKDGTRIEPQYDADGKMVMENDEPVMITVPDYQEIDQAKLVPLLTAALQEAFTKIDTLQARLDAAGL